MPDLNFFADTVARQRIAEQIDRAQRSRLGAQRPQERTHGRRKLARRLHRLADRLEA